MSVALLAQATCELLAALPATTWGTRENWSLPWTPPGCRLEHCPCPQDSRRWGSTQGFLCFSPWAWAWEQLPGPTAALSPAPCSSQPRPTAALSPAPLQLSAPPPVLTAPPPVLTAPPPAALSPTPCSFQPQPLCSQPRPLQLSAPPPGLIAPPPQTWPPASRPLDGASAALSHPLKGGKCRERDQMMSCQPGETT